MAFIFRDDAEKKHGSGSCEVSRRVHRSSRNDLGLKEGVFHLIEQTRLPSKVADLWHMHLRGEDQLSFQHVSLESWTQKEAETNDGEI